MRSSRSTRGQAATSAVSVRSLSCWEPRTRSRPALPGKQSLSRRRLPRGLLEQRFNRFGQLVAALAGDGAKHDHLFGIEPELQRELGETRPALGGRELVDLRQHDDGRHTELAQEIEHRLVVGRWIVTNVE